MTIKTVQFLAILLLTLSFVPSGAHLMEFPNKIGLDRDAYMTVQQLYSGWALSWIAALLAALALAVLSRSQTVPLVFASAAFLLMLAAWITFFVWVFPTNQATGNWTRAPENWQNLRTRWEYGHAANAGLLLAAVMAVILSALTWETTEPAQAGR